METSAAATTRTFGRDRRASQVPRLRNAVVSRGGDFKLFVCHHERGYHGGRALSKAGDDVIFTGLLPPERLATMLRACSLFVFPSAVPEAFSISAWECAAHGVVPLVYELGALAALGRVGCPCVAPGDLDGLASAAEALLADPAAAAATRADVLARTTVAARDWDATAEAWTTVGGVLDVGR